MTAAVTVVAGRKGVTCSILADERQSRLCGTTAPSATVAAPSGRRTRFPSKARSRYGVDGAGVGKGRGGLPPSGRR